MNNQTWQLPINLPTQNQTFDEMEKDIIQARLDIYKGNVTQTAISLGIGRATVYRKINQHNLKRNLKFDDAGI